MGYMTLNEAKAQLNVDLDFTEDDHYITSLIDVVEVAVENHIHDTLANLEDEDGNIPTPLVHGMKILVSHFYESREPVAIGVSVTKIPYSFEYLFHPYINHTIV
jgi:hypothetical protein